MMKVFNVGIKAIVIRDNKVLLLQRVGERPYWEVPGGRIDDDESIQQTLDRELHEELPNLTSYTLGPVVSAYRLHKDIKPDTSLVLIFYRVDAAFSDEEIVLSDEHSAYQWLSKSEALVVADELVREALQAIDF